MTVLTEGKHAAEFIASGLPFEPTYSCDTATVKAGQNLKAGQVVQFDGVELVAFTAVDNSAGDLAVEAAGILVANVDATGGAIAGAVYIARGPISVNLAELTYPAETTGGSEEAHTIASLKRLNPPIIAR